MVIASGKNYPASVSYSPAGFHKINPLPPMVRVLEKRYVPLFTLKKALPFSFPRVPMTLIIPGGYETVRA
jgi:hypothetical protein